MNGAKTKVLVALGEYPGSEIWPKVEAIRGEVPTLKAVVRVMGASDEAEGIYGYDEVIDKYNADKLDSDRAIEPDEICSLYHTGGTTGTPKLAMRTHMNEMFSAMGCSLGLAMGHGTTMMCGLPLFHANAPLLTGLAPFSVGSSVVLLSPVGYRDPGVIQNFFKIAERYKVESFMVVPTVLSMLLDVPTEGIDLSRLKYAICGAAPLSVQVFRAFEERTGLKLLEGYGLTEATVASSGNPRDGERKVGSVGIRWPYQDMKTVILDENGEYVRDCEVDEIGVIVMRGPNVFKGYVEEAHNKGAWVQGDWLNTGDMGRMDSDEYFWLTGRKKELIIRGGHNIDPAVIEEALYKIDGVALAASVGRPDAHAGEVPVAYVTPKPGAELDPDEVLAYCRENIAERAAIPKQVTIVDPMPVTAIGKIFKPALRYDAIKKEKCSTKSWRNSQILPRQSTSTSKSTKSTEQLRPSSPNPRRAQTARTSAAKSRIFWDGIRCIMRWKSPAADALSRRFLRSVYPSPTSSSHLSVPICLRWWSAVWRFSRACLASSGVREGSCIVRNVSQGSSSHRPQCSKLFLLMQQS